jgi:malonyl-CoA/methylmalonyl-CoA synthetase
MDAVLRAALAHLPRTAVAPAAGAGAAGHRYADVLAAALGVSAALRAAPLAEARPRLALLCDPGPEYVAATFGAWLRRGVAVPLAPAHPDRELAYALADARAGAILATPAHAARAHALAAPLGAAVLEVRAPPPAAAPPAAAAAAALRAGVEAALAPARPADDAILIYTSGATGAPKGALHTHASLDAQVAAQRAAWEWAPTDRILHALPLHHIHGAVNALYCALASGATVEFLPRFSPAVAWDRLRRRQDPVTVFMGVPTMYSYLLASAARAATPHERAGAATAAARLRLAVCGSAALPPAVARAWAALAGTLPLERYGSTEAGMVLGQPLRGERRPGVAGAPFPGVEVRLAPLEGGAEGLGALGAGAEGDAAGAEGAAGELRIRSPQLFAGYWGRPEATAAAFDAGGWFRTGDVAVYNSSTGEYRLLGRASVDVLKRGGFKVSALAVEAALAEHPAVREVAVVGAPDGDAGDAIVAVAAPAEGLELPTLGELRGWAGERLPPYARPTRLVALAALPRNAMGKVNKAALRAELVAAGQAVAGAKASAALQED